MGLFIGQNLVTIKEVDSTNSYLKQLLSNSTPLVEGTVIMADAQIKGRGQQENIWHSEPGKNLTFSLLLTPTFLAISQQFDLTRVISLGVFNALEPILGDKLKIKWPNDIYYADRKLAGILIETHLQGSKIKDAVVGIGLNVNQETFAAGAGNAISLKQILQKNYDLKILLAEICGHIEVNYLKLKAGKFIFIRNAYLRRLYWLHTLKEFKSDGLTFTGSIVNVKDDGLLVVENNYKQNEFSLKQIEFLNK